VAAVFNRQASHIQIVFASVYNAMSKMGMADEIRHHD
jgi:hypothetical protein